MFKATIHYATPPMKIGKHEWRCIVIDFYLGGRCTQYQFRKLPEIIGNDNQSKGVWKSSKKWCRYNSNDTYDGLPKTLAVFYENNRHVIKASLNGQCVSEIPDAQFSLF